MENVWTLDPIALALAALGLALYGHGFLRLRRAGAAHADVWRALLFSAGVVVSVLALVSPVDAIGEDQLLAAHMVQHPAGAYVSAPPGLLTPTRLQRRHDEERLPGPVVGGRRPSLA